MTPKFRAWDKSGKRYEGSEVCLMGDLVIKSSYSATRWVEEAQLFNLCQYTGMKDVNGVEIYEGDILKCTSVIYTNLGATGTGEYEETIKQVIWNDDSWGTRVISSNLTSKGAEKSGLVISAKYAEIIGNIHNNPELLED